MNVKRLFSNIITSGTFGNFEFDERRKIIIINSLLIISIPIMIVFIMYHYHNGNMDYFTIDAATVVISIVLLFVLRRKPVLKLISGIIILVFASVLYYLYMTGAIERSGPVFSLMFPILTLYLYGLKRGSIIVCLYVLAVTVSTAVFHGSPWFPRYSSLSLFRYGAIFSIIFLFSLIHGYVVEWSIREMKEAVAFRDRFISILAHDLKGPMGTYHDIVAHLTENYRSMTDREFGEMMQTLRTSTENNYNLLVNLLQWSMLQGRMIAHNPAEISLSGAVAATAVLSGVSLKQKELILEINIDDRLSVHADENMLSTVLRNLLSNAIKYTGERGSIRIASRVEGEFAVVTVSDTGMGMSDETCRRLFLRRNHVSLPGTGGESGTALGLVICREFVERNGGSIWVESREGKGSDFHFTVPLSPAGSRVKQAAGPA